MRQPRVIQRFSSLLLATLLLFMAVWEPGNLPDRNVASAHQIVSSDVPSPSAKQSQSGKAQDAHKEQTKLSTARFEAVVTPAIQLDESGQTAFLLPAPTLIILLLLSVTLLRHFTLPHFYFSYFRHVFGHHIATNAP